MISNNNFLSYPGMINPVINSIEPMQENTS
jgi:hypothetical protein